MSTRQKRNTKVNKIWLPLFCITLSSYFFYHSLSGRSGLEAHEFTQLKHARLELKLADMKAERKELEKRVLLLKAGTIEQDMLDEQARYHLNLIQEDEIAIFYE